MRVFEGGSVPFRLGTLSAVEIEKRVKNRRNELAKVFRDGKSIFRRRVVAIVVLLETGKYRGKRAGGRWLQGAVRE